MLWSWPGWSHPAPSGSGRPTGVRCWPPSTRGCCAAPCWLPDGGERRLAKRSAVGRPPLSGTGGDGWAVRPAGRYEPSVCDPSGPDPAGVGRDAGQPHVGDHRSGRGLRAGPRRRRQGGGRQHRGDPGAHPALELGADLVVHSATKYLNGHSDVLAGAVLTARRDPLWERIRSWRRNVGAVLGPFEAWLLQRDMRTLFLRVGRASSSALAVAGHLQGHPALRAVLYPGLASHPGYQIAARQMHGGFGGMLSIRLVGGAEQAMAVPRAVRVF